MNKKNVEQVIKKAVLLERQSQRFYEDIADRTNLEAVRTVFSAMGAEEQGHEQTLLHQYNQYLSDGTFGRREEMNVPDVFSKHILSEDISKEIEAASYEGAAISAAIGLEQSAVNMYSRQAEEASDKEEKQLFQDLAAWEETHLQFLTNLHRQMLQDTWFDGIE